MVGFNALNAQQPQPAKTSDPLSLKTSVTLCGSSSQVYALNYRQISFDGFKQPSDPGRDVSARPVACGSVDVALVGVKHLFFTPTASVWTFMDTRDQRNGPSGVHEYDISLGADFNPAKIGPGRLLASANYTRYGYPKPSRLLCWTDACLADHLAQISARYELPLKKWGKLDAGSRYSVKLNDPHRGMGIAPFVRVSHTRSIHHVPVTFWGDAASARAMLGYFSLPSEWQGYRVGGGASVPLGSHWEVSGGVSEYKSLRGPAGMNGPVGAVALTYQAPPVKLQKLQRALRRRH